MLIMTIYFFYMYFYLPRGKAQANKLIKQL